MMDALRNVYYSFPVQLFILHFRKYQILLLIWYVLFSTVAGGFMKAYGADTLFLSPEYLGKVNPVSAAIVGIATAVFVMSWHITTFILHSHRYRFLATASKPFLKYCLNNSILPLVFLIFFLIKLYFFTTHKELLSKGQYLWITAGFIAGYIILILFSFAYFFGADRQIVRSTAIHPEETMTPRRRRRRAVHTGFGMKIGFYLTTRMTWKKARDVSHYGPEYFDRIFKRHHFAAMISMLLAFIFMIIVGYFLDYKAFQFPAAASILIFFSILIALIGAMAYFLQSWSVIFMIALLVLLNILYRNDVIDPRNRAYGIDYSNKAARPSYTPEGLTSLCSPAKIEADKQQMLQVLNNWKAKQGEERPIMVVLNVSGGGLRSAAFVMDVLQRMDSVTNGKAFKRTFLITGASGGMLSATYFRELFRMKQKDSTVNLSDAKYREAITGDLLNPVFSSMVSRDIFSPPQRFSVGKHSYVKDRGYAFEKKLDDNTGGVLNKTLADYAADEKQGNIPLVIYNSVITSDGRKLLISSQPVSFLMRPEFTEADSSKEAIDAIDFGGLFKDLDPYNLRVLTALRMNATFPYVLPNVWLPTNPVIDAMDAGIRDNYGQETSLRFVFTFREWIKQNTSGVLVVQITDRQRDGWEESSDAPNITHMITNPATIFENNWYKLQDYFENEQLSYISNSLPGQFNKISFTYIPDKVDKKVPLNFHITNSEREEVFQSLNRKNNVDAFQQLGRFFNK